MKILLKIYIIMMVSVGFAQSGDFLMPDKAFQPYAKVNHQAQIEAGVVLGKSIYLYEDKLSVSIVDSKDVSILQTISPESLAHDGDMVFFNSADFLLTLKKASGVTGLKDVVVKITYQGCSEEGLCYEPSEKSYSLVVDSSKLGVGDSSEAFPATRNASNEEKSQTDSIADTIKSGNVFIILLTFFGFGLLLAMTPCVFPMIPIISGLIISQGKGLTTKKAFALSLTYVLAMAVAYTIAGVLAGLFGANLQAALQTPWVVYGFSFVFVALAFSMFGFYELKLPDRFVTKISSTGGNSSGYVGVAIMGFLSALIVGPCVAAPLAGALVYIGQTGDAFLGGMALFSMSIGMGVPLIVVGVSAGKFMPRPGEWMTMVTAIFGVMMLGVAIWMLEKIVDSSITMILYSVLGIGFALFLGVFEKKGHFLQHSVAMILFIYSVSLFIAFLAGSTSMTKPLAFLNAQTLASSTQTRVEAKDAEFAVVKSIAELDALLEENKGKKIMLDFSADWCAACKELEEITFADATVKAKMNEFVLIRADVTENGDDEKALSKKYGVFGPPAILFFDKDLNVRKAKTIIGFTPPEEFLTHLNNL
jgi:thioredoxin:protein disulfide reductase